MCHFLALAGQPEMLHKNFMRRRSRMFKVQALHEVLCLFWEIPRSSKGRLPFPALRLADSICFWAFYEAVAFSLL